MEHYGSQTTFAINDDGEFSSSYKYIYPKQLELKLKNQGEHATFLDLGKTIEANIFVCKLFNKGDSCPFFIVRMPYLSSNISWFNIFIVPKNTSMHSRLTYFVPKTS